MTVSVLDESKEGSGALVKVGDKVVIHSIATVRTTGVVFDNSRDTGKAYTIAVGVNKSIPGMDTALQQMRTGGRRMLLMTADEAYGEHGLKPHVPPHADVIYDVEILAVNESLVSQGIRVRKEEEDRVQRFLKLQDAERALEAARGTRGGENSGSRKSGLREANASSSGSSDESDAESASEDSDEYRKRRKKEKRRKRLKELALADSKYKSKKHKKKKREKKEKKKKEKR